MRVKMICAALLLAAPLWTSGGIVFETGTPVFEQPEPDARCLFVINRQVKIPTTDRKTVFISRHPLARYHVFYRIPISDDVDGWASPGIRVSSDGKSRFETVYTTPLYRKLLFAAIAVALAVISGFWLHRRFRRVPPRPLSDAALIGTSISFLVLLRWLMLLLLIIGGHNIITSASDDPGYFETAMGFIRGDFSGPWRFTIGHGFLYIPFILALNAEHFYDIAIPFAWFAGFFLMPGCLAMTYLIIRKLTGSQYKGFFAALLWTLIPFFYFHFEFWDEYIFKSFFALPRLAPSFRFYRNLIGMGFNAMSDTPSTFFILLCILLAVYLPARLRSIALISGIYGFACLIRINNVFFAPLIAWLFWLRFNKRLLNWRFLLQALGVALGVFMAIFGWQLIVNKFHFGHYFTFPYILHDNANDGFRWIFVGRGIRYLAGANLAYWALGCAGLVFIADRRLRVTLILWGIPVILFFFGYACTYSDAYRFIMPSYSAMLAALVCADVWDETDGSEKIRLIVLLTGSLLLVCPSAYFWQYQLPWDMQMLPFGAAAASILNYAVPAAVLLLALSFRRNLRLLGFALCFMVIYFPGNPFVFAVLFVLFTVWALFQWGGGRVKNLE